MEPVAEGPGLRFSITSRFRVRSEVMVDRKKEPRAAAGLGLESDCPRRTWLQELPGVDTDWRPCPKPSIWFV